MDGLDEFKDEISDDNMLGTQSNKYPRSAKIIIIVLSVIIFLLLLIIILAVVLKKDENNGGNKEQKDEPKEDKQQQYSIEEITNFVRKAFCGDIIYNKTYAEVNDIIENTFRKDGGKNYQELIGDVNGGRNYTAKGYNKYDLYIPYSVYKTNKTKGIIVFVHGGAWVQGTKEEMTYLAQIYYEHEYIIVNLDYTLLTEEDNTTNIYRQLDEISACIEHAKNYLISIGLNKDQLQFAIGGGSAGGHLSLLYGYLMKKTPLPLRFINGCIGPVNLEVDDYLCIERDEDTLPDLEPKTVENALKTKNYSQPMFNDPHIVRTLNLFIGSKYTKEEIDGMLVNGKINKTNEKYNALFKEAKYGFPINWMEGKDVPIFAFYGGKDIIIGFVQYARLKEAAIKYGNTIELVYSRYGGHGLSEYEHEEGRIAAKDYHYTMLKFCEEYFVKY